MASEVFGQDGRKTCLTAWQAGGELTEDFRKIADIRRENVVAGDARDARHIGAVYIFAKADGEDREAAGMRQVGEENRIGFGSALRPAIREQDDHLGRSIAPPDFEFKERAFQAQIDARADAGRERVELVAYCA